MSDQNKPPKRYFKKGDEVAFKEKVIYKGDFHRQIVTGKILKQFESDVAKREYGIRTKEETIWFLIKTKSGFSIKKRRDLKWPDELTKEEEVGGYES